MSTNRAMDKEEVINTHNGILPSHKKEQNGVTYRDMDGPRMSYKVKFKSEREKQISNIKTYTWNLEKWYRWSYLQSRK